MAVTQAEPIVDAEVVHDDEPTGASVALVRQEHADVSLFRTEDPVEVIAAATRVANALKGVVQAQNLIQNIAGKEHPLVEAWQTLGAMLGVSAVPIGEPSTIAWPHPIPAALKDAHERGLSFGFSATYTAVKGGAVVGGGSARCVRTESKWKSSDDQNMASMAQTRAISKTLSGPLRFVMALAGYSTTPAEEMPDNSTGGAPNGPEVDDATGTNAKRSLLAICGGDKTVASELWEKIKGHCGGYMPRPAAIALLAAGAGIPTRGGNASQTAQQPPQAAVVPQDGGSAPDNENDPEREGMEDEALAIWEQLTTPAQALKKVNDCRGNKTRISALVDAGNQALELKAAGPQEAKS